jgi:ATP-dependent helicase HrpB
MVTGSLGGLRIVMAFRTISCDVMAGIPRFGPAYHPLTENASLADRISGLSCGGGPETLIPVNAGRFPIFDIEADLRRALTRGSRVIIHAPTGSGKSTQIPQMILDRGLAGGGQILVLQPRRLAARMLARWVAQQRGTPLGAEVGYQVRFESRASASTRIKYETDGLTLRQLVSDPRLSGIGAILFDEFHERHLFADVLLALTLRLQKTSRPDLKLVVMSATLDGPSLERHLAPCEVLRSEGRTFPVQIEYLPRPVRPDREAVWDVAAREFGRLAREEPAGDGLVFMPGAYEIRRTLDAIRGVPASRGFRILPLYGELKPEDQDAAVARYAERKVVVATNVAETSLTIDGVTFVIDSGLARKARFDPHRGINTLLIEKISRASSDQRAGRAGRTAPGRCLRLWTEREQAERLPHDPPEIRRLDLAEIVLTLKELGVGEISDLPWLDAPEEREVRRAVGLLGDLGALRPDTGAITDLGRQIQAFPLHPRLARLLIEADQHGCIPTLALVAALCQERSILLNGQNRIVMEKRERVLGEETESDLLLGVRAWRYAEGRQFDVPACAEAGIHAQSARTVQAVFRQLMDLAERAGLRTEEGTVSSEAVRQCVLAGYADQLARRQGAATQRYQVLHGRKGILDRNSTVRNSEIVVATEIQEIGLSHGETEVRLSQVTAVEPAWLRTLYPGAWRTDRVASYDPASKAVAVKERVCFGDLVMEERRAGPPTREEAAAGLAELVVKGELVLKQWDHRVEQWIARVNLLAERCPDLGVTRIGDEERRHLIEQVCLGATGYKDIKEKPVWPVVRAWLAPAQQVLVEQHAPERLTLSNGRTPRLVYEAGKLPHIALRIQELYGVDRPLSIGRGRIGVLVHVLAPNQQEVQITEDMGSFWKNVYPGVKQQLQRRYPKHEWR